MPAMKPTLLLDFANSRQLGPLVTFTRASTTWRMGRRGLLESVPSGAPSFDHDPATLACLGLTFWESRTNLLLHSRDLTNAAWVTTAGTGTETKDAAGADGVANAATRLTATSANFTLIQSITSASASRATTAYVRRITGNGTVEFTADGGTTWTPITLTSSYARVAAPVATITNPAVGFRIVSSGDEIAVDLVQCETGAFATPPIDTAGSQVTRAGETAVITGDAFTSLFRADRGTLLCEYIQGQQSGTHWAATISDGTTANYIGIRPGLTTGSAATFVVVAASSAQAFPFVSNRPIGSRNIAVGAYAANDFMLAQNGVLGEVDTSGNLPAGLNQLRIGRDGAGNTPMNGYIRRIVFYPDRLSNADLLALSAP